MRVTIEKLVYGGAGLARTEQGVVFVPRTAPGDVLEVELTEKKNDYALARITSMLEPSPDRQSPTCPNYETAGCCHWQHIRYPRQVEIKESILRETLQRLARISWDGPISALTAIDHHYRLRASFHVHKQKVGFVEERSHRIVPILECNALSEELNAFIPEANAMLADPEMAKTSEVHAISGPPVLAAFDKRIVGKSPVRLKVRDWTFDLHPEAFFQTNRHLLAGFLEIVLQKARGSRRVLDLFCGSGFFAIPLAREAGEVLGVESSRTAIKQAQVNARLNHINNAEFFEASVVDALRQSPDLRPDLVTLNPPRSGAGRDVADLVASLGAERILYISCNPSTFARETPPILARGYTLQDLTMVDQFPNTFHIELIATFQRKA
jgi:23S rRNA (uracil1939-C5)-methyltransferase